MSADELLHALPIRDVRADGIVVDFEPGPADDITVAGIAEPRLASSLRNALHYYFGAEGGVEVVVRQPPTSEAGGEKVVANLRRLTTAMQYIDPVPGALDMLDALPLRGIKARAGSAGNCGGIVVALVDLEPGPGFELSLDGAELPDMAEDFPDFIEEWVDNFAAGIRAAFENRRAAGPPIRVVVHKLAGNYADANQGPWRKAGGLVVEEAVRRTAG